MTERTQTAEVECDLDGHAIIPMLSDVRRLPLWAPEFAPAVELDSAGRCEVIRGGDRFRLRLAVGKGGCVVYLRTLAGGGEGGAFLRVLPRPRRGSVVVMTVPVEPGGDASRARANIEAELACIVSLCAHQRAPDDA